MKLIVTILILSTITFADENKLPEAPKEVCEKQTVECKCTVGSNNNWLYAAVGAVLGVGAVSFFYYNRNSK